MATLTANINGNWSDIKTSLSLTEDVKYTMQNFTKTGLYIFEGAEPSKDSLGIFTPAHELINITPTTGNGMWVRTKDDTAGAVVVTPS